jgi:hypothetical protein
VDVSRKMQRRTRDTCWCLVRGKVRHVNDLHDRCVEIVFDHAPGEEETWGAWPETNPQRRRRILDENRAAWIKAHDAYRTAVVWPYALRLDAAVRAHPMCPDLAKKNDCWFVDVSGPTARPYTPGMYYIQGIPAAHVKVDPWDYDVVTFEFWFRPARGGLTAMSDEAVALQADRLLKRAAVREAAPCDVTHLIYAGSRPRPLHGFKARNARRSLGPGVLAEAYRLQAKGKW